MSRVFLSPSDQFSNTYAYGGTNEAVQCMAIAVACKAALERSGVEVNTPQRHGSLAAIQAASDAFSPDLHVPIHTNAFNGQVSGTRLFCLDTTGDGYRACKAIMAALAPITPGTSDSIRPAQYYEILYPKAPTAYVEVEFHDVPEVAKWIIEHSTEIGEALARGICDYLDVGFIPAGKEPAPEPDPVPESGPDPEPSTIYRVQVGAFAKRENAEIMLARLKADGYDGYIRT